MLLYRTMYQRQRLRLVWNEQGSRSDGAEKSSRERRGVLSGRGFDEAGGERGSDAVRRDRGTTAGPAPRGLRDGRQRPVVSTDENMTTKCVLVGEEAWVDDLAVVGAVN